MRDNNRGVQDEWRDIPGYDGIYQVSWKGEIRSYRIPGKKRLIGDTPVLLRPRLKTNGTGGKRCCVKLTGKDGAREIGVMSIVVDVWLGGGKEGYIAYHKNGDKSDNCMYNIGFATPKQLGEATGAMSQRKPVAKLDEDGNIVEVYPSAEAAGKANFISGKCVANRCNGVTKRHGGLYFAWDM